ncbi:tRNA synthetase, class II [Hyphomonas neptunium ATCC 15444]|uniref:tRNA synthetase, class II n=2 Tax=Hyphomonas TaxID=85 RepID=Q0BXH8_HYPNA|nr:MULTISPECIES: EF-P lysine aminoacylase EpmA [Hyphomonas]ABI77959.1 tRNA synthetase, class II [Hyphomonas neptunium ATCC 15444]KCZ89924.1 tRNA synthetase, class II [Hyphomonas hirschiana VP5]
MDVSGWWNPEVHARRRGHLLARGRVKTALRRWFDGEGFVETECGALVVSPGNEAHLHAFETQFVAENGQTRSFYLHTSPEFAMKKLLAAGEPRIFDFARAYRNRETGDRHAPEFTMLEWYRAGAEMADVMGDCVSLARIAAEAAGKGQLVWKGHSCDPGLEPETLTLVDAFERYARIDLARHLEDIEGFHAAALAAGVGISAGASWTDIFSAVLVTKIEPHLGMERLTFLCRYPISEAALSRPAPDDPRFAERFEMYACGVELANGYRELTDAVLLEARQRAEMHIKEAVYGERYPLDPDFIDAVAVMPEASGVALGFDRLAMLASGAPSISDVLWTPPVILEEPAS